MGSEALDVSSAIGALGYVATGAVIALHQPRHPVGWSFLFLGLSGELFFTLLNYGIYGTLTAPGQLPAAGVALGISSWFWSVPASALAIAMLLFPNGRPPSVRWWLVAWIMVGAMLLFAATDALRAPDGPALPLESPIGTPIPIEPLTWLASFAALMYTAALVGAGASLVVRFRRSRGAERQQLKWFVGAASVAVVAGTVTTVLRGVLQEAGWWAVLGPLGTLSGLLIPVSAAIAILRYRLYDIDLIIRKTLQYGLISGILALVYFGGVVRVQGAIRAATGQDSPLLVVISTLAIAMLFGPLRTRVQTFIDRRFYRTRYDAARTLEAFAATARHETDLEHLSARLEQVVQDAVQPASISLWLRSVPADGPTPRGKD